MAKGIDGGSRALHGVPNGKPIQGGSAALESLLETITKIDAIDLAELDRAVEARKTKIDRFEEKLEKGLKVGRKVKRKNGRPYNNGKGPQHWRTRKKYLKEYHKRVRAPKNRAKRLAALRESGWYGYMVIGWKKRRIPIEVTLEEWEEAVGTMENVVPYVERLDTSKGISLRNIVIRDADTGVVVFDGAEYVLRTDGLIL